MRTGTFICPIPVITSSSIETGLGVTLVDIILAVAASEPMETQTGESVDSIHTRSTIKAGAAEKQKQITR